MKRLALLLLLAASLRAQTITVQPANQSVSVGQPATFSLTVSSPCLSVWWLGGTAPYSAHLVAVSSTPTFTLPAVSLAQNGTTVQAGLYGCQAGSAVLYSNKVTLTVTPPAPSTFQFPVRILNCTKCDGSTGDDSTEQMGIFSGALISIAQDGVPVCGGAFNTNGEFSCSGPVNLAPVTVNLTVSIADQTGKPIAPSFTNGVSNILLAGRSVVSVIFRVDIVTATPRGLSVFTE